MLGKAVHRLGPFAVGQLAGRQGLVNSALKAGREVEEYFVDRLPFASPVPLSIVRLTADMIFKTRIEVISDFMETFDKHDKREALEQFIGRGDTGDQRGPGSADAAGAQRGDRSA